MIHQPTDKIPDPVVLYTLPENDGVASPTSLDANVAPPIAPAQTPLPEDIRHPGAA
jgi:hypothetical protein